MGMQELDDNALLHEYVVHDSETAFATLVNRHVDKVYSVALRQVRNPHQAEEITQAVFVILARQCRQLGKGVILSGWLYQTARYTAVTFIRSEVRRARREEEAHMQRLSAETESDAWPQIAPLLDTAMGALNETDRHAIVLRYFDDKSMQEVGAALGGSEDAAKMRINRAVEKLRRFFTKRGIVLPAAVLAATLSSNAVQAAPAMVAKTATALALAQGATTSGSTLTLIKGALKLMAWTKAKTAIIVGLAAILTVGTTAVIVQQTRVTSASTSEPAWADDPKFWANDFAVLTKLPPVFILRPTRFRNDGGGAQTGNRIVFKNVSLSWLIATAYGQGEHRSVFPEDLPQEKFDLMLTLPGNYQETLKAEIKKRFGLVAHRETREVDVLEAKVATPNAPALKISSGSGNQWIGNQRNHVLKGQTIDAVIQWLEGQFKSPMLNQTGLTNHYDLTLKWTPRPGQSESDAIRQFLLGELGIELVPARAPVEMLVTEKAE